ncbi:MAG: flagellar assembly protein A [Thermodesulfobacteriota bacterium]|nr:flagellar assembly protein A [Thermodesulfobacteriota bacterium]
MHEEQHSQSAETETAASPPASPAGSAGDARSLLICRLAIDAGLISEKQAARAKALQEKVLASGRHVSIETILVKENAISRETAEKLKIAAIRQQDKAFCRLAVKKGLISKSDADAALSQQATIFKEKKTCVAAADLLQSAGLIKPEQAAEVLRGQGRPADPCAPRAKSSPSPRNDRAATDRAQKTTARKQRKRGLELTVSGEPASAYLVFTEMPTQAFTVADVNAMLADHKIVHGILPSETIAAFLKSPAPKKQMVVAQPTPPQPGKDAAIRYNFDTGIHQRIGTQSANGKIDYREKGAVPKVDAGDVIAEKIPPAKGADGVDIYGNPLPAKMGKDIELKADYGVQLSENHLKAIASTQGQPRLSFGGRLSVSGDHKIDAINMKTGHVTFEGNIFVKTVIESGFKVKGNSIKAAEIFAATIDASGDVEVGNGITGANINARGNVKAKYLKNARVMAFGDVIIQKEIIDSTVITSGACKIPGGKIISSRIIAKHTIQALQVGTEVSSPCHLKIGVDEHAEREIEAIGILISEKEADLEEMEKTIGRLHKEEQTRHKEIAALAQVGDKANTEIREITAQRDAAVAEGNDDNAAALNQAITALDGKAASASKDLESLLEKQEETDARVSELKTGVRDLTTEIEDLQAKAAYIAEWVQQLAKKAIIHINGIAYEDTVLEGRRATLTLSANRSAISVKEIKTTDPQNGTVWKIRIKNQMRA